MKFARVIGTLVATRQIEGVAGVKWLVVQPLNKYRRPEGDPYIAADATAQAGPGELVFVVGSREAAQALPEVFVPVDHAIVGIVDDVSDQTRATGTAVWRTIPADEMDGD
jgi:ethanolamine utilization protein EutN